MATTGGPEDPVFCRCGMPATAHFITKPNSPIHGCTLYRCHFSGHESCQTVLPVERDHTKKQLARAAGWVSHGGDIAPGADLRLMLNDEKQVVVAVRVLSATSGVMNALRSLGGKEQMFLFTNSIGVGLPAARIRPGAKSSVPPKAPPRECFVVFPFDKYDALMALLQSELRMPPERIFRPPAFVLAAVRIMRELEVTAPPLLEGHDIYTKLHPYQRDCVAAAIKRGGRLLIADEMGLGKTIQALAVAHWYRTEGRLLIICPSSLCSNWEREVVMWWNVPSSAVHVVSSRKGFGGAVRASRCSVVIVSYALLPPPKDLSDISDLAATLIVDESHMVKNPATQRAQAVLALATGMPHVVLLTGTPSFGRPIELYTQLRAVCGKHPSPAFPNENQFKARYCNALWVKGRGQMVNGSNRLEELTVLLQPFMVRRRKQDVLSQLPAKLRQVLYLSLSPQDVQQYEVALRNNGGALDATALASPSSLNLYVATAKAKVEPVKDYVQTLIDAMDDAPEETENGSADKMLFFAFHKILLDAIEGVLSGAKLDYIRIDGGTPTANRGELVEHFQTQPSCRFAVLSIAAAGTGLNFTAASKVIFCELDYTPSNLQQCEDRIHRMGQQKQCLIKYLIAQGTTDEALWQIIKEKIDVATVLLSDTASSCTDTASASFVDPSTAVRIVRQNVTVHQGSSCSSGGQPRQQLLDAWLGLGSGKRTTTAAEILPSDSCRESDVVVSSTLPMPCGPSCPVMASPVPMAPQPKKTLFQLPLSASLGGTSSPAPWPIENSGDRRSRSDDDPPRPKRTPFVMRPQPPAE